MFTFKDRYFQRGQLTFDGDELLGQVWLYKPLLERLRLDATPARYLARLPSGQWLPGEFRQRHDAAEALWAHARAEQR